MSFQQPFRYLSLISFECNQGKNINELKINEIIEMTVFTIEVHSAKIIHKFHTYVQPTFEKELTMYTIEKTGITNELIFPKKDAPPNIYLALQMLHKVFL